MERKILVALLQGWLEKEWNGLGRDLVPKLKPFFGGEALKAMKFVMLECLEEAFAQWMTEQRQKLEESKK